MWSFSLVAYAVLSNHVLILNQRHLTCVLTEYMNYYNTARPHQGLGQRIPEPAMLSIPPPNQPGQVLSVPVLGGLHHDYRKGA